MVVSPSIHQAVLLPEVITWLKPRPGEIFVDGTLGGGGHTGALAAEVGPAGRVLAFDRDPDALARAETRLAGQPVSLVDSNFCDLPEVLKQLEIARVQGVLLDLGLSSDQLADRERGFSFDADGPLDLRFNPHEGEPAARLVNKLGEQNLADLIFQWGEERYSRRIAKAIVAARRERTIETAAELAAIVRKAVPRTPDSRRIDPATRTFQALRIATNQELRSLEIALRRIPDVLAPGGRLAVISFHSLEDRLVKHAFRDDKRWTSLTKRPILPSEAEQAANIRARSAKLRVAERAL